MDKDEMPLAVLLVELDASAGLDEHPLPNRKLWDIPASIRHAPTFANGMHDRNLRLVDHGIRDVKFTLVFVDSLQKQEVVRGLETLVPELGFAFVRYLLLDVVWDEKWT